MMEDEGVDQSKDIKLEGRVLFIMGKNNPIRKLCRSIVANKLFDPFILFMIAFSTILLTLENPLDNPNSQKTLVLRYIDIVVTIIFVLECLVKVSVYGFLLNGQ